MRKLLSILMLLLLPALSGCNGWNNLKTSGSAVPGGAHEVCRSKDSLKIAKGNVAPRGKRRLIYVSDPSSIAMNVLPDPVRPDDLRRLVNWLADNGVDTFDQEVYSQCWAAHWRSDNIQYDQRAQHKRYIPMIDEGIQPLEIYIDQSHKRGMTFIAGFRVNDGHGYKSLQNGKFPYVGEGIAAVIKAHPDWELIDVPEGCSTSYYLDFTSDGVRAYLASVIQEVIDRFDVDGVELCFRDCAYFPVNKGTERAHLMTDLVRKIHKMLEEKGKSRNKKLVFGARVFSTVEECLKMGLDVPRWVNEGLIDYLSPMDTMWVDFNLPFADFAAMTHKTDCMLYPGLLPWTSQRARTRLKGAFLSPSTSRAYAYSCYQNGADGISIYNHCATAHSFQSIAQAVQYFPQSMQIFRELRDPVKIAAGERHYIFDIIDCDYMGYGPDCALAGKVREKIILDRSVLDASGKYKLQLFENMELVHDAGLLFRSFGLTENDELEVRFNGHLIDDDSIGRSRPVNAPFDERDNPAVSKDRLAKRTHKAKPVLSKRFYEKEFDDSDWGDIEIGDFWGSFGYLHTGIAWYRLQWPVPAEAAGYKKLLLAFGAVDEEAWVWINGEKAGEHAVGPNGWEEAFEIDVTKYLKPGQTNTIAIKVKNIAYAGGIWKPIKLIAPKPSGTDRERYELVEEVPKTGWKFKKVLQPVRWFPLDSSMVEYGQNTLSVTLKKSDPKATAPIVIDEVEVWVKPR